MEESNKKEKELMDRDNSVVITVGSGGERRYKGDKWQWRKIQ